MSSTVRAQGCLRVYEPRGRQPVTYLCAGRVYWIRSCTPPGPGTPVYYDKDSRDGLLFNDTTTILTLTTPGRTRVTQLINRTPNVDSASNAYTVYPTAAPRITVATCLRSVQVTLTDTNYTQFAITFTPSSGAPQTVAAALNDAPSSALLSGGNPGSIRIRVTGTNGGRCPSEVRDTTVQIAPLPVAPRIRGLDVLAPTSAGQVQLIFDRLTIGAAYILERALLTSATWTPLDTLTATATDDTLLVQNAPTRQLHRYRLRVRNGTCTASASAPTPPVASSEAAAVPLSVTPGNRQNTVSWPTWPGTPAINAYLVFRNGVQVTRLPAAIRAYTDPDVTCQRRYCYEVMALSLLPGDTLRFLSSDSCVIGTSTLAPNPPKKFKASFDLRNNLVLTAVPDNGVSISQVTFSEQPRTGGGSPTAVGTSPTAIFALPTPDTAVVRNRCYSATLTDSCGLTSAASPSACPVVLRVTRDVGKTTAFLSWTTYQGFATIAQYHVQLLDDQTNAVIFDTLVNFQTSYNDRLRGNTRQVRRYRIRAEFVADTFAVSYSNLADLTDEAFIRLPNAFTPNGDQLNDTFGPTGRYELRESEIIIYDRWGKLLFQTTKPGAGWDGRAAGGEVVPPGVYIYRFRGRDASGREYNQRGMVTVLR